MIKRIAFTALLLATSAISVMAAPVKAKVASVQDRTIVLNLEGGKAAWIKKGATVSINKKLSGRIVEVTETGITVTSAKAGQLQPGDSVTFDKSLAASGC